MSSDLCLRLRGIRGATQNFTYSFSALLVLTPSMTNPRSRGGSIRNSRIRDCGTSNNPLPIHTGTYAWKFSRCGVLRLWIRIYYMFANMASLNNWRRMRGFSESSQPLEILYCHLTGYSRYIRVPPSLWRSWRYWPPDISFPHIALHISWNLVAQGSCPSISVLPQANRNRDEPLEQQRVVFDIRTKPASRLLQDWVECQLKHRWPTSVPLHQGWVFSNARSISANKRNTGTAVGGIQRCSSCMLDHILYDCISTVVPDLQITTKLTWGTRSQLSETKWVRNGG